jgi:hypothetical protein
MFEEVSRIETGVLPFFLYSTAFYLTPLSGSVPSSFCPTFCSKVIWLTAGAVLQIVGE